MFETVLIRRVVLIADATAERSACGEIERLGFLAYSSVRCSGGGLRGAVQDVFSESSHVRIEALGSSEQVRRLMQYVDDELSRRHAVVCFTDSVEVSACTAAA